MNRQVIAAVFMLLPVIVKAGPTAGEAVDHVGKHADCGTVASAKYAAKTNRSPTLLNLEKAYPHHLFTVLIWGVNKGKFDLPRATVIGTRSCVSGEIQCYEGRIEIVVASTSQTKPAA